MLILDRLHDLAVLINSLIPEPYIRSVATVGLELLKSSLDLTTGAAGVTAASHGEPSRA